MAKETHIKTDKKTRWRMGCLGVTFFKDLKSGFCAFVIEHPRQWPCRLNLQISTQGLSILVIGLYNIDFLAADKSCRWQRSPAFKAYKRFVCQRVWRCVWPPWCGQNLCCWSLWAKLRVMWRGLHRLARLRYLAFCLAKKTGGSVRRCLADLASAAI